MLKSFTKISSYIVTIFSFLILFISYFLNYIIVNEELLNIPVIEPDQDIVKTLPTFSKSKQNVLEIEILKDKNKIGESNKIITNKNVVEPLPFEVEKNNLVTKKLDLNQTVTKKPNLPKVEDTNIKTNVNRNKLKKYRVQLGSFKNKVKAESAIKNLTFKYKNIFFKNSLEIYELKKSNYTFYRVWSNLMNKNQALELCKKLKDLKTNCILKIDKNKKIEN